MAGLPIVWSRPEDRNNMMMRLLRLMLLAFLVSATPAAAEPITLHFSGHVTNTDATVASAFSTNTTFRFSLTYDPSWIDTFAFTPTTGLFIFPEATSPEVFDWSATVGNYHYSRSGPAHLRTSTTTSSAGLGLDTSIAAPSATGDVIPIGSQPWYPVALDVGFLFPELVRNSDSLFPAWPDTPWSGGFSLYLARVPGSGASHASVQGTIDAVGVPTPATLPLMAVGFAGVWWLRRRRS
jgi:hypothetical protein